MPVKKEILVACLTYKYSPFVILFKIIPLKKNSEAAIFVSSSFSTRLAVNLFGGLGTWILLVKLVLGFFVCV